MQDCDTRQGIGEGKWSGPRFRNKLTYSQLQDMHKEKRLRGQPGWEHLDESLHVLITANHPDQRVCSSQLHYGMSTINGPDHSDPFHSSCSLCQKLADSTVRCLQEGAATTTGNNQRHL
jgi:hypothetical protein